MGPVARQRAMSANGTKRSNSVGLVRSASDRLGHWTNESGLSRAILNGLVFVPQLVRLKTLADGERAPKCSCRGQSTKVGRNLLQAKTRCPLGVYKFASSTIRIFLTHEEKS
jgi:hypothetical protein